MNNNEVLSISDSDILYTYLDQWKTPQTRDNIQYQGVDTSDDSNVTALTIGAGGGDGWCSG